MSAGDSSLAAKCINFHALRLKLLKLHSSFSVEGPWTLFRVWAGRKREIHWFRIWSRSPATQYLSCKLGQQLDLLAPPSDFRSFISFMKGFRLKGSPVLKLFDPLFLTWADLGSWGSLLWGFHGEERSLQCLSYLYFYRTQVYLGSDLWVQVSVTNVWLT